eukprot:m.15593 g.15593  ORF g.15593 m.15593 type:complete len:111 (-) comp5058_c0_seq1:199-531(-)
MDKRKRKPTEGGADDDSDMQGQQQMQPQSKADKRAHHNALERKRRDHIKDSFATLRDSIPALASEKASRAQILNKATDYIVFMRKKNATHQSEMEELRKQNSALQVHLRD